MRPKRFFFVMVGGLVLLAVLIIGTAFGGHTILKKESSKLTDLKLQEKLLEEQQKSLDQAKKDIEKYANLDTIARAVVPQDKDQAKTVRTLTTLAEQSGIRLRSITFPASSLGQAVPGTTSGGTAATSTPAAPTSGLPSQSKAVPGIPGVFSLEIEVESDANQPVAYSRLLDFLQRLENSRRTAHVERITITPTDDNSGLTFKLTLNAYIKL